MNYITIDGGTSNTRISLVKNKELVDTVKLSVGARNGINDTDELKNAVKCGIEEILQRNGNCEIERILASGMITSEFGLYNLEHALLPMGLGDLHNAMEEVVLSDVSEIPFVFMRGVKFCGGEAHNTDIMRGEETELMGIMEKNDGECLYVLPGSHSKLIKVDKDGKICEFSTMLTGEMIWALSQSTILKDAVDLNQSEINNEYLLKGASYSKEYGINEALFKCRVLKNILKADKAQVYSFFMGTVLWGEIDRIIKSDAKKIVVGGRQQIKDAMCVILKEMTDKEIVPVPQELVEKSTSIGMIKIYEN